MENFICGMCGKTVNEGDTIAQLIHLEFNNNGSDIEDYGPCVCDSCGEKITNLMEV